MVNYILGPLNLLIRTINSVISLAQKVPGLGGKFSSISEIKANFGRLMLPPSPRSSLSSTPQTIMPGTVNITGNTFLDENSATKWATSSCVSSSYRAHSNYVRRYHH